MADGLRDGLARARTEAGAVVIAGRPGRFSAGFDLGVMTASPEGARNLLRAGAEVAMEIFAFPMPVVIASTGHALAMGGILIVPVGRDPTAQVVERIVKSESGLQRDTLMPVRFVPLVAGPLPVLGQG